MQGACKEIESIENRWAQNCEGRAPLENDFTEVIEKLQSWSSGTELESEPGRKKSNVKRNRIENEGLGARDGIRSPSRDEKNNILKRI